MDDKTTKKVWKVDFESPEQLLSNISRLVKETILRAIGTAEMTILAKLELSKGDPKALEKIVAMELNHQDKLEQAYGVLENFYYIVDPKLYFYRKQSMKLPYNFFLRRRSMYLAEVVANGLIATMPEVTNLSAASKLVKQLWVYRLINDPNLVPPRNNPTLDLLY